MVLGLLIYHMDRDILRDGMRLSKSYRGRVMSYLVYI